MSRRTIQVFNMSFLDMMTNFLGAVIILFLLAAQKMGEIPYKSVKGTAKVILNEKSQEINGKIDLKVGDALQAGDTLLVIIEKKVREDGKIATAPPKPVTPPKEQGVVLHDNQVVVDKTEFDRLKNNPTAENKCLIYPTIVKISPCNDNGTPNNADDDTYTAEIKVSGAGKCATLWRDDKSPGPAVYEKNKTYTFKMKDGPQKMTVSDNTNRDVQQIVQINPPPACAGAVVVKPVDTNNGGGGSIPPGINFQVEFDANMGNVDLYVEKEGHWVYGGKRRDDAIGQWTDEKIGFLSPGKTGLEKVRQLGTPVPGTYKIYAHYKKGNQGSMKVALIVSSKLTKQSQKFDIVVPLSGSNPKQGGGMLLKTVTVGANGSLKF